MGGRALYTLPSFLKNCRLVFHRQKIDKGTKVKGISKNVDSGRIARRGGPKKPECIWTYMRIFWVRNEARRPLATFLEMP